LSRWVPARVVSCSWKAAEVHEAWGYPAHKFSIIPNGYSLEEFGPDVDKRAAVRRELAVPEGTAVIGMVARFDRQKDHGNLLAALAILREQGVPFLCLLAGAGVDPQNERLTNALRESGLEGCVRLLGQRDDVASIMTALDVHVLSSAGEAFPNVLAEAMACEVPCVTTNVGDAALIVDSTGWIVPPRDSKALAGAIRAALCERREDPSKWETRRRDCRRRIADHFSADKMASAYRDLWLAAVAGAK
jgi:glycosyltransferase involved in cell wall biosynthesis